MASWKAYRWSGSKQPGGIGKPKDRVILDIPVGETAPYEVILRLTKAHDYGIAKISVNDQLAAEVDLYDAAVKPTELLSLGHHELNENGATISISIVGRTQSHARLYVRNGFCLLASS